MDFAREYLGKCVQEARPLLEAHHEELTPRKDLRKLNPQWMEYAALEAMNRYAVFTAREDGRLVGYAGFHIIRHLHDRDFTLAQNDVFYLLPEHRRGVTALRYLRYCTDQCKVLPVHQVVFFCSKGNNLAPILHRIGYADEQTMVSLYF
jgi:L-amino acid N-acyltransferase YncA